MKRLDLIISAIEDELKDFATDSYDNDYHGCCGADLEVGHTADCKLAQALAVARSLRELEPVAWMWLQNGKPVNAFVLKPQIDEQYWEERGFSNAPLYALGDDK